MNLPLPDPATLPWELLGTFLAVMRTGSLSGASRTLGVAQPTVRRQIEKLEEVLGAVLFTRSQTGLAPTETALTTLPYAESMASVAEALVRSASAPAGAEHGTVRVTCSEVVGVEVLPPILAELRRTHPQLQIELSLCALTPHRWRTSGSCSRLPGGWASPSPSLGWQDSVPARFAPSKCGT